RDCEAMSLCTWATVVSTVPSRSVNGAQTQQIWGNFSENGETSPLPTFLYFLELLEELNRDGNDKFPFQVSYNSSSNLFDGFNDSADELDSFFDGLLNDDIIFDCSAAVTEESSSTSTSTPWTSEPEFLSLNSEYFATHGFDYVFPVEASYKQDVLKSGHMIDKVFCDWSPELFEEEEIQGKKNQFQRDETKQNSAGNERGVNGGLMGLSRAQEEPVKHKRKRKCKSSFQQRQESRSSCKSLSTMCRQGYYGNANILAYADTTSVDSINNALSFATKLVHDAKTKVNEEYIRFVVDLIELRLVPPLRGVKRGIGLLVISNISRIGYNEIYFGWEKAVYGEDSLHTLPRTMSPFISVVDINSGKVEIAAALCFPTSVMQVIEAEILKPKMRITFNKSQEKTTKGLMNALGNLYEKHSASNKIFLMKKLFKMKMSKNGSVVDHLNEFNMVVSMLNSVKIDFDDEVRALLILCSLSDSWDNLVMVVSNSVSNKSKLKFEDVIGVILSEEMRRKSSRDSSTSRNALTVESRGRQKNRGKGNHGKLNDHRRSNSKSKLECWQCGKVGHAKKD
ncbi:hypothetical protein KI387_035159, partial [Taxus chinensis]